MAEIVVFNEHDGKKVAEYGDDRWVEQYHGRNEDNQVYEPYKLICTHVVHFTENKSAKEIDDCDFCFKAYKWQPEQGHKKSIKHLIWWAAVPPESWKDNVKSCIPDLLAKYKGVLGNSPAFNGNNGCGPIGFVISWKDILNEYAESRGCKRTDVELRILGTFRYSAEIMYGVLVCIKDEEINYTTSDTTSDTSENGDTPTFPELENSTEAFEFIDDENGGVEQEKFIWKVYSTIGFSKEGVRSREIADLTWDHLSFAFYFPERSDMLKIPPKLCRIETKLASTKKPDSRSGSREKNDRTADRKVVDKLKKKISDDKLSDDGDIVQLMKNL